MKYNLPDRYFIFCTIGPTGVYRFSRPTLLLHGGAGQVGDQAGRGGRGRLPGRLGTALRVDQGDGRFVRTDEGTSVLGNLFGKVSTMLPRGFDFKFLRKVLQ